MRLVRQCSTTGTRCSWLRKSLDSGKSTVLYSEVVSNLDDPRPTMSPDGTQVLVRQQEFQKPLNWAVVIPVSGGSPRTLSIPIPVGEVGGLKWAPDGMSVLLVRQGADGVDNIWSAPFDGGPPKQMTRFDSERIVAFDVAPDRRLAVVRGTRRSDVVMIKNVR